MHRKVEEVEGKRAAVEEVISIGQREPGNAFDGL